MKTGTHKITNLLAVLLIAALVLAMTACNSGGKKSYTTRYFTVDVPGNYSLTSQGTRDTEESCTLDFIDETNNGVFWIWVRKEPAEEFRHNMIDKVDLKAYSSGELPTTEIGGLPFIALISEGATQPTYFCRDEKSGMSITIFCGDQALYIEKIISSIRFTLPDPGLTDPPYPWEKEMIRIEDKVGWVGTFKIETRQLSFDERIFASGSKKNCYPDAAAYAAASKNFLYTLDPHDDKDQLNIYRIGEDKLEHVRTITLPEEGYMVEEEPVDGVFFESYGNLKKGILVWEHDTINYTQTIVALLDGASAAPDQSLVLLRDFSNAEDVHQMMFGDKRSGGVPFFSSMQVDPNGVAFFLRFGQFFATENYVIIQGRGDTVAVRNHELTSEKYIYGGSAPGKDFLEINGSVIGLYDTPMKLQFWNLEGQAGKIGEINQEELLGLPNTDDTDQPVSLLKIQETRSADGTTATAEFILLIGYRGHESIYEILPFKITITG
ncbi:MAG: hypothetical protein J5752_11475 [Clostridiales bacterium]|nr:hypothetical protein [Clostridiales bacterium]